MYRRRRGKKKKKPGKWGSCGSVSQIENKCRVKHYPVGASCNQKTADACKHDESSSRFIQSVSRWN